MLREFFNQPQTINRFLRGVVKYMELHKSRKQFQAGTLIIFLGLVLS
jgi:hypothetical protein